MVWGTSRPRSLGHTEVAGLEMPCIPFGVEQFAFQARLLETAAKSTERLSIVGQRDRFRDVVGRICGNELWQTCVMQKARRNARCKSSAKASDEG